MKIAQYKCDGCHETIPEDEMVKLTFDHGRASFDLRDEEFELCLDCASEAIEYLMKKKEKRP